MAAGTADGAALPSGRRDFLRVCVPFLAAGSVVFAAVTDPGGPGPVALLVVAAGLYAGWALWPPMPTLVLAAGVITLVVLAKLSGELDGGLFLVSLLVVVIAGWERSRPVVAVSAVAALLTPLVIELLNPGDIDVGIWMIGVAFPGVMSWLFRRQEELTAQLEDTRRQLMARMVSEERRRIARDVHDLVGHGLAAVLLQVTSARHVLHRDLDEAERALRSAEDVGRRSLADLRGTVALLRADGESVLTAVPGLEQLPKLVDDARAAGVTVERRMVGDHDQVDPVVSLALYRVAQEALVNAARHAPHARTTVTTQVRDETVELTVQSLGQLDPAEARGGGQRPGYGLVGMRERAAAVGGQLHAGPVPAGWLVHCSAPIDGQSAALAAQAQAQAPTP